ncbi:hypothetical protein [Synechococcus sp. UW179A]|uniref:hypothetical protein n=1 Tax=Synechococcus sp. UW179A TaxID=2575510 RepID=UPI0010BE536F|nr:hypothetical protein [Synechococcus sp. UW179A]
MLHGHSVLTYTARISKSDALPLVSPGSPGVYAKLQHLSLQRRDLQSTLRQGCFGRLPGYQLDLQKQDHWSRK